MLPSPAKMRNNLQPRPFAGTIARSPARHTMMAIGINAMALRNSMSWNGP